MVFNGVEQQQPWYCHSTRAGFRRRPHPPRCVSSCRFLIYAATSRLRCATCGAAGPFVVRLRQLWRSRGDYDAQERRGSHGNDGRRSHEPGTRASRQVQGSPDGQNICPSVVMWMWICEVWWISGVWLSGGTGRMQEGGGGEGTDRSSGWH